MVKTFKQLSVIGLACALVACGGGGDDASTTSTTSATSADQDQTVTSVGLVGEVDSATADAAVSTRAVAGQAAAATGTMTVRAHGSLASNIGPIMQVRINNTLVGQVEVRATVDRDYTFNVGTVATGAKVEVIFNNDTFLNGEDRNLFVTSMTLNGTTVSSSATSVVFDRGRDAKAFDNIDVLPGLSTLWWDGALRFAAPAAPGVTGPVTLAIETGTYATNRSISLSSDKLSAAFGNELNTACANRTGIYAAPEFADSACHKRAVRASGGIKKGEFRYYEGRRLVAPANIGFGYTTASSAIDPYCCLVDPGQPLSPRTPPSMSINVLGGTYVQLRNTGGYHSDATTQYYGFAVDYTGSNPVVYVVTAGSDGGLWLSRQVTPGFDGADVIPFTYGHTYLTDAPTTPVVTMNFGQQPFHYNLETLRSELTAYGANATKLVPGVGPIAATR